MSGLSFAPPCRKCAAALPTIAQWRAKSFASPTAARYGELPAPALEAAEPAKLLAKGMEVLTRGLVLARGAPGGNARPTAH